MLKRNKRIQREEEEDRADEEKLKEFKKEKRPTKRRMEDAPNDWKEPKKKKWTRSLCCLSQQQWRNHIMNKW